MKKMKSNPTVSVIIPVYNPGYHLRRCLDSIRNQTYHHLEIILVVDGSFDESDSICDKCASEDPRVVVVHKTNGGVSKARNIGLKIATGDYFYFPDSDDYIDDDTFEYLLDIIHQHHCDAAVFEHYITYSDHEEAHRLPAQYYGLYEGGKEIIKIYFRIAFTCNKLFSNKLITGNGSFPRIRFDETISRGEDGIFSRTVLDNADRVYFTDRPLYHYVQSEQSACRGSFRPSQLSLLKAIELNIKWFSEKYPEYLPVLYSGALGSYITLYYDMWSDENDYHDECNKMYERFHKEYSEHKKEMNLNIKQRIKYLLFDVNPSLFCRLHRFNQKRYE